MVGWLASWLAGQQGGCPASKLGSQSAGQASGWPRWLASQPASSKQSLS